MEKKTQKRKIGKEQKGQHHYFYFPPISFPLEATVILTLLFYHFFSSFTKYIYGNACFKCCISEPKAGSSLM